VSLLLNATGAPGEIAARAGNCVRVLQHAYTHCIDGREELISQQIEDALDPTPAPHHIVGLLAGTFRTFIHILLRGAGGARTHDRRIMRSMTPCTDRASCTDRTDHRTDGIRGAGII